MRGSLGGNQRGGEAHVGCVGFRRRRDIGDGLGHEQLALRPADAEIGVPRCDHLAHRLRVGHADILGRGAGEAAEHRLPGLAGHHHARGIVECRVHVGAAQRLVEAAQQVVMPVAGLVVHGHAPLQQLTHGLEPEWAVFPGAEDQLGHVEQVAAIAAGEVDHRLACLGQQRQGAALLGFGAGEKLGKRRLIELLEHQHLAARQQRAVQFKGWVFSGGPHQHHGAVLDHRQEAVLLGAVEAVDLVAEQQRACAGSARLAGILEDAAEFGDAALDRGDGHELPSAALREQPRDGGLPRPRRSPQDDGGDAAGPHHAPQRRAGAEKMCLPHHLGEGGRADAVGEGAGRGHGTMEMGIACTRFHARAVGAFTPAAPRSRRAARACRRRSRCWSSAPADARRYACAQSPPPLPGGRPGVRAWRHPPW